MKARSSSFLRLDWEKTGVLRGNHREPRPGSLHKGEKLTKVTRLYTEADNQSHFADVEIPLEEKGKEPCLRKDRS